jgi:hypothetical protein
MSDIQIVSRSFVCYEDKIKLIKTNDGAIYW